MQSGLLQRRKNFESGKDNKMNICLFGAASDLIDAQYVQAVECLGELMAQKGHTMIYGGGATGLMGAAARGMAKVQGHQIIGIAPRFFDTDGVLYKQCSEMIFTETMRERKALMEEKADAFLMVPGGTGTLEEFFEVLTLNQLHRMKKPIAIYNINGYFDDLHRLLQHIVKTGFTENAVLKMFEFYENAEIMLKDLENRHNISE